MSTLAENAAAVKAAQVAIDAAIVAKGGTTTGGLSNAAAAIEALKSGDPQKNVIVQSLYDLWLNTENVTLDFTGLYDMLVQWRTSHGQNSGQIFRRTKARSVICPWMECYASYCFGSSSYLNSVSIYMVGNNSTIFTSSPNLEDIYVSVTASVQKKDSPSGLAGISENNPNTVVHCSDADLKYIEGAWVVVERN